MLGLSSPHNKVVKRAPRRLVEAGYVTCYWLRVIWTIDHACIAHSDIRLATYSVGLHQLV